MYDILVWLDGHLSVIPATIAAIGALYGARKVTTIEVNTNSRLSENIKVNEELRTANLELLGQIAHLTGRIEGTETPIAQKEIP